MARLMRKKGFAELEGEGHSLPSPLEENIRSSEIEQERRERISAGMRRAAASGRPIGRPTGKLSNEAIVAKYPAVMEALQGGLGVRVTARETGVAINTVQKVRAALAALKAPAPITLVLAAQAGDQMAFDTLARAYRPELLVHCYRMLGSLHDAEDLVQETLLRAWEKRATLTSPESYRAWLYRIATNLCLNMLSRAPRRSLPSETHPQSEVSSPLSPPIREPIWLEPFPDDFLVGHDISPEDHALQHEHLTLAFLVALQQLTPVQRSILLLREVLEWSAAEVADWINLSVPAVNSALQRARRALRQRYAAKEAGKSLSEVQALLERYMALWEQADVPGLVALMREDAWFTMPPVPTWFQGRDTIATVFASRIFTRGRHMRVLPTRANGSPAFAAYQLNAATDDYRFAGLFVLDIVGEQIGRLDAFMEPSNLAGFALPISLPA